jgi:hypothetical protein
MCLFFWRSQLGKRGVAPEGEQDGAPDVQVVKVAARRPSLSEEFDWDASKNQPSRTASPKSRCARRTVNDNDVAAARQLRASQREVQRLRHLQETLDCVV